TIKSHKTAVRSKLYENQYAIFFPSGKKLEEICRTHDKKEFSFTKGEIEFSASLLRYDSFYPYEGRRDKSTNQVSVFFRTSPEDGLESGILSFTLPKNYTFQPALKEEDETTERFTFNYLELTPIVFTKEMHIFSLRHFALLAAEEHLR
ncbi:MAG: hypothetical protein JNJ47_07010, partial [Alphaproteobacteria bacterium]|nr:hypothetical protein [Alphaproteobacteria bacterium]